ncbi:hypothetical protein NBRC116493_03870 [Aurantivibrio infirmus]
MPQEFWRWFENNIDTLNNFEPGMEDVLDSVSGALNSYNPNLAFEISQPTNGVREFVISAEGVIDEFKSVIDLYEARPELDGWEIIAFRPRMPLEYSIDFNGLKLHPDDLWIYWREDDGNFDLIVYFPTYDEEQKNTFVEAAYILLDMAIGEYYVAAGIRYIDHQKVPENPEEHGLLPFKSLPEIFFEYIDRKG